MEGSRRSWENVQLWHQGWHDAHADLVPLGVSPFRTEEHFVIWLREARDAFYVAADDSDLLGFASIKGVGVVKLYVGKSSRGTGAAHALLSFAEKLLRDNGVANAELLCTAGNTRAERFYAREGWSLSESFEDVLWLPEGTEKSSWCLPIVFRRISDRTSRFRARISGRLSKDLDVA